MKPVDLEVLVLLDEGMPLTSKEISSKVSYSAATVGRSLRSLMRQGRVVLDPTSVRRRFVRGWMCAPMGRNA